MSDSYDPMGCIARQALLSMGFSRQEYWSGLPFPFPGDLLYPGIEPGSPALQTVSLPTELRGEPLSLFNWYIFGHLLCLLLGNVYSHPLPTFNWVVSLLYSCLNSLYILGTNPLSDVWFTNMFSHFTGRLFTLLIIPFAVHKLFSLLQSHLSIFWFCCLCFWGHIQKGHCLDQCPGNFFCFSSSSFIVWALTCKCFIHFEFILV